jgi:hypothetical protein
MAYYLAMEHTKLEIARLFSKAQSATLGATVLAPGIQLSDVFKLESTQLGAAFVNYQTLVAKEKQ